MTAPRTIGVALLGLGNVGGGVVNVAGFSHGLSAETAAGVARFLFAAFLPFGLIGLWTALRLLKRVAAAPPAGN